MALCSPNVLRGIHAQGKKIGLDHEALSGLTSTGSLATVPEHEAATILRRLQQMENPPQPPFGKGGKKIWRLYPSSTLAKEIDMYRRNIRWPEGGFEAWLKHYHGVERLEWVSSYQQAVAICYGLKSIYNREHGGR